MSARLRDGKQRVRAFTLLELATVIVIIAILVAITLPILSHLRARAQRVQCAANLKSLAAAADLYVQEKGMWPQIAVSTGAAAQQQYAEAWIEALAPFGPMRKTWICPTAQNLLHNPDYSTPNTARIDYFPTSFDDTPTSPHEWPRQPWFVESGDLHGNGNLIIFTDGSISDLKTVVRQAGQ